MSITRRQLLLATGVGLTCSNYSLLASAWRSAQQLPYPVQEIYPALHNSMIVVAGGIYQTPAGNLGVTDSVVAYDLHRKTWSNLPKLPEPRHHPMLCSVAGVLYSFSGFTVSATGIWVASKDVLRLDEDKGQWLKLSEAEMPFPMCETVSMVRGSKIHLVTGRRPSADGNTQWRDHSDINHHLIFDTQKLTWQEGPAAPSARNSAAAAVIDGLWYIVGGRTVAEGNKAVTEVFNPETNRWSTRRDMPQAQGGLAAAAVNNKLYVFGGEFFQDGGGVYSEVWEYLPSRDYWRQVSFMPIPRHGLGAIAVDKDIYVVAGAAKVGGRDTTNVMSIYSPK